MLHNAFDYAIDEDDVAAVNKDGNPMFDENGNQVFQKVRSLDRHNFNNIEVITAYDNAIAFIDELVTAFEEE